MQKEVDSCQGITIYQLTDGSRPSDNIYGEQPYSSPDGARIAVRHYPAEGAPGGVSILDLADGSLHPIFADRPRFPAFHGWGPHVYYKEEVGDELILKRCCYKTLAIETLLAIPQTFARLSYGTVSPDGRFYAVSASQGEKSREVWLFDLTKGDYNCLVQSANQHFKHEQFALDGTDRVLIQANSEDVTVVNLGAIALNGELTWFPIDATPPSDVGTWPGAERYTPRCTGHETWVGQTGRIFCSTGYDDIHQTNIWTAGIDDAKPQPVGQRDHRFGHISVSRCGQFWIGDAVGKDGIPIHIGCFDSGKECCLVQSRTEHDGKQWSHTHPYLTADNRWLIFTSNRTGLPQVFGARIPEEFLKDLAEGET